MLRLRATWILMGLTTVVLGGWLNRAAAQAQTLIQPGARPESSLALRIVAIYERRQALDRAPWHATGGEWTFLECEWPAAENARFLVGLKTPPIGGGASFDWGEVRLAVNNRASAERIVRALAGAFGVHVPPNHGDKPTGFMKMNVAMLGTGMMRSVEGGFSSDGRGGWTATKWFLENDAGESEAEIYFNFNLREKRAEFSEKDFEFRDDIVERFVVTLRDGPMPPRTPEHDPNLTSSGPRTADWSQLTDASSLCRFTPDGQSVLFLQHQKGVGSQIQMAAVAAPRDRKPLGDFKGEVFLWPQRVEAAGPAMVITEVFRREPNVMSPDDPQHFWLVSQQGRRELILPGEPTRVFPGPQTVSPDGRFLLFNSQEGKGPSPTQVLLIYNVANGQWRRVPPPGAAGILGWEQQPLRAIIGQTGEGAPWLIYAIDPATGRITPIESPPARYLPGRVVSPDGRRYFKIVGKERLVLGDVAGGATREFVFRHRDRRSVSEYALRWADGRYVQFGTDRQALIDTTTLKMSFPEPPGSQMFNLEFNAGFSAVLASNRNGCFLGRVVPPTK
jgi:hypothetical protein